MIRTLLAIAVLGLAPAHDDQRAAPQTEAEEVTLALSAAPASMRAGASVWVLGKEGYRQVRPATNGLSCLVEHERTDTSEPICWDAEGTSTIMPVTIDRAKWRAAGVSEADIARRIADRFADGTYRAPRRSGIAYMLSAHNYVFNGERVIHFTPHVMAYAPYLRNADIGATGDDMSAPWVLNEGSPHAYIILATVDGRR